MFNVYRKGIDIYSNNQYLNELCLCNTFAEAIDKLEKLYKVDKALYEYITCKNNKLFQDHGLGSTSYFFIIGSKKIECYISNVEEEAEKVWPGMLDYQGYR